MSLDVFRCLVWRRLGFFWRAFLFIVRSPGGPDWPRALCYIRCSVVFNLVLAVCFRFFPWITSPAMLSPVSRASWPNVLAPLFNKGMAALNSPPNILPRPCPLWNRPRHTRGIRCPLGEGNNLGNIFRRFCMVASFQIHFLLSTVKCHHHSPSFEWDDFSRIVPYIYLDVLESALC